MAKAKPLPAGSERWGYGFIPLLCGAMGLRALAQVTNERYIRTVVYGRALAHAPYP